MEDVLGVWLSIKGFVEHSIKGSSFWIWNQIKNKTQESDVKIEMSALLMIQWLEFMALELLLPKELANISKKNAQNFCLLPFQDLIGRIVPLTSVGRFINVLAPHIQEICTLVRKLTHPWDRIGKGEGKKFFQVEAQGY